MDKLTDTPALIEKFPVHFYEDGIRILELRLSFKQRVAIEHFKGNTSYTMKDCIAEVVK